MRAFEFQSGGGAAPAQAKEPSGPLPVAFGAQMGWLHPARGRRGVVLCNTLGYQALLCRPALRALADRIAAAGLPCLRFDYASEGDSLGDTDAPGLVEAWLDGTTAAADYLKGLGPVCEVAVVGFGFGALAAHEAAARRAGLINPIVLLAPPASGRALVRQMRAEAGLLAAEKGQSAEIADGGLSIAGFEYTRETLDALSRLTLKGDLAPAEALVLAPQEPPPGLAAQTQTRKFAGYAAMLAARVVPHIPDDDWRGVAEWLAQDAPPAAPAAPAPSAAAVLVGDGFVETGLRFGAGDELAGVLCAPAGGGDACTVFLNTGANTHIGWARGAVTTGRRLASEAGIAALRMDLRGLGESAAVPGGALAALYEVGRTRDIDEAVAMLKRRGYRRITLIGQCSGAFAALHCGLRNADVDGLVLVNLVRFDLHEGETVQTLLSQTGRSSEAYVQMLWSGTALMRLLRGDAPMSGFLRAARKFARRGLLAARETLDWILRPAPKPGSPEAWLHQLAGRGVRTHMLFSETDIGRDEFALHLGQLVWRRRRIAGFEHAVLMDADHNLSTKSTRAILYEHARIVGAGD